MSLGNYFRSRTAAPMACLAERLALSLAAGPSSGLCCKTHILSFLRVASGSQFTLRPKCGAVFTSVDSDFLGYRIHLPAGLHSQTHYRRCSSISSPEQAPEENHSQSPNSISNTKSLQQLLQASGIILDSYESGNHRLVCHVCNGGSTEEKSLSVSVDEHAGKASWTCFRANCGTTGRLSVPPSPGGVSQRGYGQGTGLQRVGGQRSLSFRRPSVTLQDLPGDVIKWFAERSISEHTLRRNKIGTVRRISQNKEQLYIAFPYFRKQQLVNVKYRSKDKKFHQETGTERILYGLDDIENQAEVIIVEGELDKLALEEAGFLNVVSVPDGAPAAVRDHVPDPERDAKFSFLYNCQSYLDPVERFVLATDNDAAGDALAEELARRLGRERCFRVRWARGERQAGDAEGGGQQADSGFRKDANEVLMKDGREALRKYIEDAEEYPIRGLLRVGQYRDTVLRYFKGAMDDEDVFGTGWGSVDALYKVVPGEVTVVTGVPNSGKSEFLDALTINLSHLYGWTFALCSFEKQVHHHVSHLVEKYVGRPFRNADYAQGNEKMSEEEMDVGLKWVDQRFHFIRFEERELPSVDDILHRARGAVMRYGIRGLVIDPYNELDAARPRIMSETEYVSQIMSKLKRFAHSNMLHIWFVAHPRVLPDWQGEAPMMYSISGSAHFANKADNVLVVHRTRKPADGTRVMVKLDKVRNKAAGKQGLAFLYYDKPTGRYIDPGPRHQPQVSEDPMEPDDAWQQAEVYGNQGRWQKRSAYRGNGSSASGY